MPPALLREHPSPSFLSDRSLSPDFVWLSHIHSEKTGWGHRWAFESKVHHYRWRQQLFCICTASQALVLCGFSFFLTILIFLFLVLTHLGATHKSLSAYSGGFCEPVTYKVSPYLTTSLCHSGLKCLPHDRYCDVRKRWQDLLRVIFLRIGPPPVLGFWKKGTSQAAVTLYVNKRYEWRCRECK